MQAQTYLFPENGWVPNNPRLPVILYEDVFAKPEDVDPRSLENLFKKNAWRPRWRDVVYDYHHYHSTSHETLGVAAGSARLMVGGPHGKEISVRRGHVLIIPAGVAHCRLDADADFLVIGAYPAGQENWDMCRSAPDHITRERIAQLPIPESDPATGPMGLLTRLWRYAPQYSEA